MNHIDNNTDQLISDDELVANHLGKQFYQTLVIITIIHSSKAIDNNAKNEVITNNIDISQRDQIQLNKPFTVQELTIHPNEM